MGQVEAKRISLKCVSWSAWMSSAKGFVSVLHMALWLFSGMRNCQRNLTSILKLEVTEKLTILADQWTKIAKAWKIVNNGTECIGCHLPRYHFTKNSSQRSTGSKYNPSIRKGWEIFRETWALLWTNRVVKNWVTVSNYTGKQYVGCLCRSIWIQEQRWFCRLIFSAPCFHRCWTYCAQVWSLHPKEGCTFERSIVTKVHQIDCWGNSQARRDSLNCLYNLGI